MAKMTPEQEARYALNWEVAKSDLPKGAQLAYDRLVEERARADPQVPVSLGIEITAAAAGRGYLRASHADREHVIDALKAAFVQGRLTKDEFELRVSQTLTSRTYADLATLTADLPAGLIGAQLRRKAAPAQAPAVNKPLLWGSYAILMAAIGSMAAAFPAGSLLLLSISVLAILIAAPIAGTLTLDSWREKHSHRQPPPPAARRGHALDGEPASGTGNNLILCGGHEWSVHRSRHRGRKAVANGGSVFVDVFAG
jgi:Domain of unknown function (DUF1707)